MLRVLKAFVSWCNVVTALVIYSKDLSAQDRAIIKIRLMELKEAVRDFAKKMSQ